MPTTNGIFPPHNFSCLLLFLRAGKSQPHANSAWRARWHGGVNDRQFVRRDHFSHAPVVICPGRYK